MSLIIEKEISSARIRDRAVGTLNLEKPTALNGKIEGIVGLIQVALGHDDLRGGGLRPQANLQPGRDRLLALRCAWRHEVLVDHVLELESALTETRQ